MNYGPSMEYRRILYRSSFNVYRVMLKGESMKYECVAGAGSIGCVYRKPSLSRLRMSSKKPEPAKRTILARPAVKLYYKLHNGDILDIANKMILSGEVLKGLLDG